MDKKININTVLTFAGSIVAFLIGAGFATGQEVLQYFTAYAYQGIAGGLLTLLLLIYACSKLLTTGYTEKFKKGNDIYRYFCGKTLGICFDWFSVLFCFLSFIVMVAGASATMNQYYNQSPVVGALMIGILTCITVSSGLLKLVGVIGRIGPVVVAISIVLGVSSIFKNYLNLNSETISVALVHIENETRLVKASTSWYLAAFSYVGFCMLWLAGFLASLGAKANSKMEARLGGICGAVSFSLAVIIVACGLLAKLETVAGTQVPMLYLAEDIHPLLPDILSLIVLTGIYTTAVPLLWSVSIRFAEEKGYLFKIITIVLTVAGVAAGVWFPFDRLVNVVYVINGYFGGILLFIMLFNDVKKYFNK